MMTIHKHGRDWKVIMGAPEPRPSDPPETLEQWIAGVEADYLANPNDRTRSILDKLLRQSDRERNARRRANSCRTR